MSEHDPLGKARSAGGILHVDGVPGVEGRLPRRVFLVVHHDGHGHDLGHGIHAAVFFRSEEADPLQMRQIPAAQFAP